MIYPKALIDLRSPLPLLGESCDKLPDESCEGEYRCRKEMVLKWLGCCMADSFVVNDNFPFYPAIGDYR